MKRSRMGSIRMQAFGVLAALAVSIAPRIGEAAMTVPGGLPAGSTIVFSQSGFISNTVPLSVEFDVPWAGTLSVQLIDLRLPEAFECLTFLLTTGSSLLANVTASETVSFELASPRRLFGFLNGDPQGPMNVGAYLLQVSVVPAGPVVPLPAGIWLLLSGVAGLAPWIRSRRQPKSG